MTLIFFLLFLLQSLAFQFRLRNDILDAYMMYRGDLAGFGPKEKADIFQIREDNDPLVKSITILTQNQRVMDIGLYATGSPGLLKNWAYYGGVNQQLIPVMSEDGKMKIVSYDRQRCLEVIDEMSITFKPCESRNEKQLFKIEENDEEKDKNMKEISKTEYEKLTKAKIEYESLIDECRKSKEKCQTDLQTCDTNKNDCKKQPENGYTPKNINLPAEMMISK